MKFRTSWVHASLGLIVALGFLPGIASGVPSGTATQVGGPFDCPPGNDGGGQVRISDKIPIPAGCAPDVDLTSCILTNNAAAVGAPTSIQILFDPGVPAELVRDTPVDALGTCVGVPGFLAAGFNLPPRPGGDPDEVIFESDQAVRPTLRLQVKNRGNGFIEFSSGLKVDRACINDGIDQGGPAFPKVLRTSFRLACAGGCNIRYAAAPFWRVTGPSGGCHLAPNGSNIRTP